MTQQTGLLLETGPIVPRGGPAAASRSARGAQVGHNRSGESEKGAGFDTAGYCNSKAIFPIFLTSE
jgi:hypothetical protein